MANSWYAYLGGDVTLTSSYRRTSVVPTFKKDGTKLSAVYLPDVEDEDGNVCSVYPAAVPSSALDYIAEALITGRSQSTDTQPYVCLR